MALLDQINAGLLKTLSGSSSSSSSSSVVSQLNGKGKVSVSDSSGADVSAGLSRMISAFQSSAIRIVKPLTGFQAARDAVDELSKLTDHMLGLAKRAADVETTDDQRGSLNAEFNRDAKAYRRILDNSSKDGFDYRSKFDLEGLLTEAGINPSQSSTLSSAFAKLAKSDSEVGYTHIKNEDVAIINIAGAAETYRSNGSSDPLQQDLTSQGGGQVAVNTITQLQKDLANDSKQVRTIIDELVAAGNFAIAGARVGADIGSSAAGAGPDVIAQQLVSAIKAATGDPLLASHSDLDRTLASTLLSDPNR